MTFHRNDKGLVVARTDSRPLDTPHRPSVDVLFKSAAEVYGDRVLGIVMTGMGSDGKEGSAWIKAQGGLIYTQSEDSCVVYGMPRTVVEAGLCDRALPLDELAQAILEVV
jgi:two-component system chemotaxis response regulator CheB